MRRSFFTLLLLLAARLSWAQGNELPYSTVALTNLDAFRSAGTNWKLASDAFYDLNKAGKGSWKAGTGVLVNEVSGKSKEHLFTKMEHGDLELELDFMMEKGSNSGVFLQGRYEIQLADSWGVPNPTYADCGAIYARWDASRPAGRQGYEGHPPAQNVSKAPGLWQRLRIVFRAPRFNEKGGKTANARFVSVVLNGVTIHENVEVTGPTGSAMFEGEGPTGPLVLQGDHGPVAFRNLRYKAYGTEPITLTDMKLTAYEGRVRALSDLATATPRPEQKLDVLAHQFTGGGNQFAGKITGTLHLPRKGLYFFNLNLNWIPPETNPAAPNGAGELRIGDQKIAAIDGRAGGTATNTLTLDAGEYPFTLTYYKGSNLWYAVGNDITLAVEGPGVPYTVINPVIIAAEPVGKITVLARNEPAMVRSFVMHKGQKRTHVLSVGQPGGANYTVDLRTGEWLQVWRGDFLETTPMWHGRGETQLALPMGSVIEFPGKPSVTYLADQATAWPDSNATYAYLGYDIGKNELPVIKYNLGGTEVRETVTAEDAGRKLTHSLTLAPGTDAKGTPWCRVAEGSDIVKQPNGLYSVNDKQYYVELAPDAKPLIRTTAQRTQELLLPLKTSGQTLNAQYTLVW